MLKVVCCRIVVWGKASFFIYFQRRLLQICCMNHEGKGYTVYIATETIVQKRKCSLWVISPFTTMLSTLFNNHTLIYKDFPSFGLDLFKVICCRFVAYGKELYSILRLRRFFLVPLTYGPKSIKTLKTYAQRWMLFYK